MVTRLGPDESLEAGGVPDKPCALRYDLVHVEHVVSGCGHLWWHRSAVGRGRVRAWEGMMVEVGDYVPAPSFNSFLLVWREWGERYAVFIVMLL